MKRLTALILSLSALLLYACAPKPTAPPAAEQIFEPARLEAVSYQDYESRNRIREDNPIDEQFLTALNDFSAKCATETLKGQADNMCVSPLSLYMALSMAAQGARGDTRDEMLAVLGVDGMEPAKLTEQYGNLMRRLYKKNGVGELSLANSVWAQAGVPFESEYIDGVTDNFYALARSVDFGDTATGALVSKWISENTGGLLSPDISFDDETFMALVNTVYLTDQWLEQFDEALTAADIFRKADGTEVTVDFMNRTDSLGSYCKGEGFTAAPMWLKNSGSMVFVLPDEGVSIDELLSKPENIAAMIDRTVQKSGKIVWKMPKFEFDSSPKVKEAAQAMGIKKAFERSANFNGILNDTLFISDILQGTHISVDELGVKAAAFTLETMYGAAMQEPEPVYMTLDRPFLFAIVSEIGAPLFVGVVNDAQAK